MKLGGMVSAVAAVGAGIATLAFAFGGIRAEAQTSTPMPAQIDVCTSGFPSGTPPTPTPISQSALVVAVTTDRPAYGVGEPVSFVVSVTNQTDTPATREFGGVPIFSLRVAFASNQAETWRRPSGISRVVTYCTFRPGETVTFGEQWNQRDLAGQQVPAGVYAVSAELATATPLRLTSASVQFTIGDAPPVTQTVPVPGSTAIPPGATVTFFRPPPMTPVPTRPDIVIVKSQSDQLVTVTYDGSVLTIAAPAGFAVEVLGQHTPLGPAQCAPVDGQPNVVRCFVASGGTVTFTTIAASAQTEIVELFPSCNNVSLTWPSGTAASEVAAAVTPPSALLAIWRYNNTTQTFQGFSPQFPQASDLTTVNRLDAVFMCMSAPGTLLRPIL